MNSKSKLTKLVTIVALTIPLATTLASTNKTLATNTNQVTQTPPQQTEPQNNATQEALLQRLLRITNDQKIIINQILEYLGFNLEPNKRKPDNTQS